MSLPIEGQELQDAVIKVVGVGGAGCNAINRMVDAGVSGVEFVAVNTDLGQLRLSMAHTIVQIGRELTRGLGSGGNPEIGEQAARESIDELTQVLQGADMVFVTAGMGGGTGTGASPVVAEVARNLGCLTVGVVTRPFPFEGPRRAACAEAGIKKLADQVDALIVIPNERLLKRVDMSASLQEAFSMADDILREGVQGISELIINVGGINTDFMDVRTVMANGGTALMAIGRASGQERALAAAQQAITSPLLDIDINGAKAVLWIIKASGSLKLSEVNQAASLIADTAAPDANIIFGTQTDENMGDELQITVLATGVGLAQNAVTPSKPHSIPAERPRPVSTTTSTTPQPSTTTTTPGTKPTADWRQMPSFDNGDLDIPSIFRRDRGKSN